MALEVIDTKRYTEPLGRPSDKKREEATAFFTEKKYEAPTLPRTRLFQIEKESFDEWGC